MFLVVEHYELAVARVRKSYEKVRAFLQAGDFAAAQVKKMAGTEFYRARLDELHRVLFRFGSWRNRRVILVYEILLFHNYAASRFLRGSGQVADDDFVEVAAQDAIPVEDIQQLQYLNETSLTFHHTNKIISFDADQEALLLEPPPLIIIGAAGSGKTAVCIEKLRQAHGDILYLSLSSFLVENAQQLLSSVLSEKENGGVTFYSFADFLASIRVPKGKEVSFNAFSIWLTTTKKKSLLSLGVRKLFEEFRGVLAGQSIDQPFLSRDEYRTLGVKQSIFLEEHRDEVYTLFLEYVKWIPGSPYHDSNFLASEYLPLVVPEYDLVVIDEVQDLTMAQLALVLASLKVRGQFLLCGDANQVVHPNFFSWSKVKSFFYEKNAGHGEPEVIRILRTNFRNHREVTNISNLLLKLKAQRFGSLDHESNYLAEPSSAAPGVVQLIKLDETLLRSVNERLRRSIEVAVLVLSDEQKAHAQEYFDTPLIFSVHEAKGLEYSHVILFNFISSSEREYREIVADITPSQLEEEMKYARARDKTDKTQEALKFYVNSLYVGITRAIESVTFVEATPLHPMTKVLSLPLSSEVSFSPKESSLADWQAEARRLERQGKVAQAEQIRTDVLQEQRVPWEVMHRNDFATFAGEVLTSVNPTRKTMKRLMEASVVHDALFVYYGLRDKEYGLAQNPEAAFEMVKGSYYNEYVASSDTPLRRTVEKYGPNFRNPFGETPLMIATKLGKPRLVEFLLQAGADIGVTNYSGVSPAGSILRQFISTPKLHPNQRQNLITCFHLVEPLALRLQIGSRLVKLDRGTGLYSIFNLVCALSPELTQRAFECNSLIGFDSDWLTTSLTHIPDEVIPEKWKRRTYLNGLLARHECTAERPYNRKLFYRLHRGSYFFNPLLQFSQGEELQPIYERMGLSLLPSSRIDTPVTALNRSFDRITERLGTLQSG